MPNVTNTKKVNRTKKLMEAAFELKDFRDRIDSILKKLNNDEVLSASIADEVIDIGVKIQKISSMIRPYAYETAFKEEFCKAKKRNDLEWLQKYALEKHWDHTLGKYVGKPATKWGWFHDFLPKKLWKEEYIKAQKTSE